MFTYTIGFASGRVESVRWPNLDLLDAFKSCAKSPGVRPFVFQGKAPDGRITAIALDHVESMTILPAPDEASGEITFSRS